VVGEALKYKSDSNGFKEYLVEQKKVEIKNEVISCIHSIEVLRADLTNQMRSRIKDRVYEGYSVAVSIYENNKDTKSKEEIIELIKEAVGPVRFFNERGYYFITSHSGVKVLNPYNPDKGDLKISEIKDSRGGIPMDRIISLFKGSDEGYVKYYWATPQKKNYSFLKTSYVKKLPFYDLFIGAGDYSDALEKDLQIRVLRLISDISYGKDGYVFVNKFDGTVVRVKSDSIKPGDNISKYTDENGVAIFQEQYKNAVKPNGGYFKYRWFETNVSDYRDNIAYVRSIPEWEWIVGAFVNVSSIDHIIDSNKGGLYRSTMNRMFVVICVMLVLVFLIIFVGGKLKKRIDILFLTFFKELEQAVKHKGSMKEDTIRMTEYGQMARMANVLLADQKEIFNRLENSEQRFRLLIKNVPVMIVGLDKENKVTIFNKESQKFFGKRSVDIVGKQFRLDDFFESNVAAKISSKFYTTKHQFMLRSYKTKDGSTFSHIWRHFGTSTEEKILVGYDITEQVRKEDKINDQKELLETLIETMPLPIFYKDIENGVYLGCNSAYSRFLGKPINDIVGKTIVELYPKEQAEIMLTKDDELLEDGSVQEYESPFCTKEGDLKYGRIYKAIYKNHLGKSVGILGISMDITDTINYGKNLEELNQTKDRFFSIVAHDLKNPFNSLLGMLELLREDYDELEDEERKDYLEVLNRTSNRLYRLLTNLLDWSRTQIDGMKFEPENINISGIIEDNVNVLQHQADHKGIELAYEIDEEINVNADYNMISSVVRNLINNAIKFTNKNGKIRVYAEKLEKEYRFGIEDSGVGIPQENIEKLFKIDEKLSTKGTASEVGTGLGLILCKEFIEKHKGRIMVGSEVGKGTTFCFTLPIN